MEKGIIEKIYNENKKTFVEWSYFCDSQTLQLKFVDTQQVKVIRNIAPKKFNCIKKNFVKEINTQTPT